MLPTEVAYNRYLAGEISYDEYRRLHAEPEDQSRLARIRQLQRSMLYGSNRGGVLDDAKRRK